MARITVEDCLKKVDRFGLVVLAAERVRQILSGLPIQVDRENDKNTVVALREIADGKVSVDDLRNSLKGTFHERPLQESHDELDEDPSEDFLNTKPAVNIRPPVEINLDVALDVVLDADVQEMDVQLALSQDDES